MKKLKFTTKQKVNLQEKRRTSVMIIFVGLLFLLCLWNIKPLFKRNFYDDYLSMEQTRSINGICIILILLSHTFAKITPQGVLDEIYSPMRIFLGQMVVVPFLFYSGYAIMQSINTKQAYIKTFPKKRFLKIAYQFFIITIIYILMHLILNSEYSVLEYVLSFTGITSVGNGGWYILSTFVYYSAIIICFNIFKSNKILATIGVTLCLVALMLTEILLDFPSYYYSTTIFFAVGMFFYFIKPIFDKVVMKNNFIYLVSLIVCIVAFILLKSLVEKTVLVYPVWCGFGMLSILLVTMKVKISNKALMWLGETTFFNFTLQGIPQIIFTKYLSNSYIIYILVIITTLILTYLASRLFKILDKKLFARGEKNES